MSCDGYRYGDTFVRPMDKVLMKPGRWLNDVCVSFGMEYFQLEDEELMKQCERVYFMTPSSVQLVLCLPSDDLRQVLLLPNGVDAGKEQRKEFIFIPINDGLLSMKANAGTHWALLVYNICKGTAVLFDSIPSDKMQTLANTVAQSLHSTFVEEGDEGRAVASCAVNCSPEYVRQQNSCDCGVYVIEAMRHLLLSQQLDNPDTWEHMTPTFIKGMRNKWFVLMDRDVTVTNSATSATEKQSNNL
eukprot:m.46120 g.46120  ORF g.46120 m.46120 type:complete len:244 (+) comp10708_c0_seq1:88-819(+)